MWAIQLFHSVFFCRRPTLIDVKMSPFDNALENAFVLNPLQNANATDKKNGAREKLIMILFRCRPTVFVCVLVFFTHFNCDFNRTIVKIDSKTA